MGAHPAAHAVQRLSGLYPHGRHHVLRHWVMGQSTHFATLFISLGVVGMMIGSMLAKVLTDRWCKLQVFFWTNIVLAVFSCAFYFFNPHATTLIMVLYFLLNILHQILPATLVANVRR